MADGLFPDRPEDLKALSDEELNTLLDDHVSAAALIDADDEEFLKGLSGEEVIAQYEVGVQHIKDIRAELAERTAAHEAYQAKKAELKAELDEPEAEAEETEGEETEEAEAETVVEAEADTADTSSSRESAITETETEAEAEATEVEERVPVTASAPLQRFSRTPPAPSRERIVVTEDTTREGSALVASGQFRTSHDGPLAPDTLARLVITAASELGPLDHNEPAGKYKTKVDTGDTLVFGDGRRVRTGRDVNVVWDGPKTNIARAEIEFPAERTLNGDDSDLEKILAVMPPTVTISGRPGTLGGEALVASGGLCAPLTPIYTMPNFATDAEPVWDSLPVFRAARGGVNVPAATSIGDITTAISSISEADDAAGGTFATKSCQDLTCPNYTETAVQILAHCREYGNLNARAWPEKIAHENALTMAALSRTTELFLVDRIKTLAINLTQAEVLGAYGDFVQAALMARSGIIDRLRMPLASRFNLLVPGWLPSMFAADTAYTQFDRYQNQQAMAAHLESHGFRVVYYMDGVTGGTSQSFADEVAASTLDAFPADVQWGIYPEGQFMGLDSGILELGIVRDSTLNSTNDFQVFGERFRNLAMLGPAQGALWIVQGVCPSGEFPALGTALAC